ncbi:hypothetical protein C9J48_23700 [Photobacterium profundum]|uniref:Uncharacterized protein n=1 Tax=Photobacterium profundum 3TCK TaxID=314280 RepID=Q1Z928_9GAMM|nr:hypothetical protein [Photobacterium profundum]EAS44930.1 hypothetical protein P3TCK_20640 [Photobacterium profundum 3TCK]PSV59435.1 hypothetical protein C9J48_23700 [Photobacterium profundum]
MIEVHWSLAAMFGFSQFVLWVKIGLFGRFLSWVDSCCQAVAKNMLGTLFVRMRPANYARTETELPYILRGKPASMHLGSYIQMQNKLAEARNNK